MIMAVIQLFSTTWLDKLKTFNYLDSSGRHPCTVNMFINSLTIFGNTNVAMHAGSEDSLDKY
jgi:hypothetical protein